jgi:hypothetical protein
MKVLKLSNLMMACSTWISVVQGYL